MKSILLIVAILIVSSEQLDPGLRVKWGVGLGIGNDFFFDVPRTIKAAIAAKWTLTQRPTSPMPTLKMYCVPNSAPYCCVLYDPDTESAAGLQVAIQLNEFSHQYFDWTLQGFIPWTLKLANGTTVSYQTKQLYFISEATLSKSKADRLKAVANGTVLQEQSVWLSGFNQQLLQVPTTATGIEQAGFVKQSCIPWMGVHYFYKMTRETKCTSDSILNWFLLVDSGKLIGVGFLTIGNVPEKKGSRDYFERPSRTATQTIIKYSPDCLLDLTESNTATTMHIYFVDNPWHVGCSLF